MKCPECGAKNIAIEEITLFRVKKNGDPDYEAGQFMTKFGDYVCTSCKYKSIFFTNFEEEQVLSDPRI